MEKTKQKINKKTVVMIALIFVAGSFGFIGNTIEVTNNNISDVNQDSIKWSSAVTKTVERINPDTGKYEIIQQDTTHNLLTNSGRMALKNFITGFASAQTANISMIAISNSTAPAVTDTTLAGSNLMVSCGLGNMTAVKNQFNTSQIDISWQWTNICTNQVVNTTGIFNQTATGIGDVNSIMFAGAAITSSTLQPTDKIQVNYTVNIG